MDVSAANSYGLMNRIVGIDSLIFIKDTLNLLKNPLSVLLLLIICITFQAVLPKARLSVLQKFYTESVDIIDMLRSIMYRNITGQLVDVTVFSCFYFYYNS